MTGSAPRGTVWRQAGRLGHLPNPLKFPLVRSRAVVVIVVVGGPFEHLPNGIL